MSKIKIGIIGEFQNGKSTLVNCLLGQNIAPIGGFGLSVTSVCMQYTYGESNRFNVFDWQGNIIDSGGIKHIKNIKLPDNACNMLIEIESPFLKEYDLIDTPGFNANEHDNALAQLSLQRFDLAIVMVQNRSLSKIDKRAVSMIEERDIPYILLINCIKDNDDMWDPESELNAEISSNIISDLELSGSKPHIINGLPYFNINLSWAQMSFCFPVKTELYEKQKLRARSFFETFYNRKRITKQYLLSKSRFGVFYDIITSSSFSTEIGLISFFKNEFSYFKKDLICKFDYIQEETCQYVRETERKHRRRIKKTDESEQTRIEKISSEFILKILEQIRR